MVRVVAPSPSLGWEREFKLLNGGGMNKRSGPEFAPLRNFVKSFKIQVTIFDSDDKIVREEVMDYGKPEDRMWLGKLSYWAWSEGYIVETRETL